MGTPLGLWTRLSVITFVLALALAAPASTEPAGDQFRISSMLPDGDVDIDAGDPQAAHNTATGQTLVVWKANAEGDSGREEVYGRFVDGSGSLIGSQFQISTIGPGGFARNPTVAYNSVQNEFIVAWSSGFGFDEEIWGQILSGSGAAVGTNFQIGDLGGVGPGSDGDNQDPRAAYNSARNEYLVAWHDNANGGIGEIHGQVISSAGAEVGTDDFQISDPALGYDAEEVDLVYNPAQNEYLAVWEEDTDPDSGSGEAENKDEVFGRRLDTTAAPTGPQFQISQTGAADDSNVDARDVAVAADTVLNRYLVVFEADLRYDGTATDEEDEGEIFGQFVTAGGAEQGGDFRITTAGAEGDAQIDVSAPAIAYSASLEGYFLVYELDVFVDPTTTDNEDEIVARRLGSDGSTAEAEFRVSSHGADGDPNIDAGEATVALNASGRHAVAAWEADVLYDSGSDETETEIFGRRLAGPAATTPPAAARPDPPCDSRARPRAGAVAVLGTAASDVMAGTSGPDLIRGLAGNDRISGLVGNDCLFGDAGNDRLFGNDGADFLIGGIGNDRGEGGRGNDRFSGGRGNDSLYGQAGNDRLSASAGRDLLSGGAGRDSLFGGSGNDRLFGGSGNDRLSGSTGNDRLNGGSGNDLLIGWSGNDVLLGGGGNDVLRGYSGNDRIVGGRGRDRILAAGGDDVIDARDGQRDEIRCGLGNDTVRADPIDRLIGCQGARR